MMKDIIEEDLDNIISDKNIPWDEFSGASVLITGANGMLASYMVFVLLYLNKIQRLEKPVTIYALCKILDKAYIRFNDYLRDPNLIIIEKDVSEPFTSDKKIDYIIHAASMASPKFFFSDPVGVIKANTLGTAYLLDLAVQKNVKKFLYFSSGEVNGDAFEHKDCVTETDYGYVNPLEVRNCYSESKRQGENMCACWAAQYGIHTTMIRPSHTYGPTLSLNDGRAFASFVAAAVKGEDIVLNSDGSAKRSFCYISDAIRGYFTVLLKGEKGQAYNVGTDSEMSILELAKMVASFSEKAQVKFEANVDFSPSAKSSHGLLDNQRLKALGWKPQISEHDGFFRTVQYFLGR